MSICELEEGSELSIELHPELSIFRHESDFFDELTGACLEPGVLVIQGVSENGDLPAVELGKIYGCRRGMEGGAA